MLSSLRVRVSQGRQYIVDMRHAKPNGFRGRPVIGPQPCEDGCTACVASCPTKALAIRRAEEANRDKRRAAAGRLVAAHAAGKEA